MVIHGEVLRVVPILTLFAQYARCGDELARTRLVAAARKARGSVSVAFSSVS